MSATNKIKGVNSKLILDLPAEPGSYRIAKISNN
jgi:hypothetical protein